MPARSTRPAKNRPAETNFNREAALTESAILEPTAAPRHARNWHLPLLIALAVLAHGLTLGGGFLPGDRDAVIADDLNRNTYGLALAWTGVLPEPARYILPDYRPMAYTSFFIESMIWPDQPVMFRLTNLLLHVGVVLVLYQLLRSLLGRVALPAAMVFAVHPIAVDAVSWISHRDILLGSLLGLSGVYVMLRWLDITKHEATQPERLLALPSEKKRLVLPGCALLILAAFSHPSAAMIGPLLFVIAWAWRKPVQKEQNGPLLLVSVVGLCVAALDLWVRSAKTGSMPEQFNFAQTLAGQMLAHAQIAASSFLFGLYKLVLPFGLSYEYPRWPVDEGSLPGWGALAILVAAGVVLRETRLAAVRPLVLVALATLALYLPVSGLLPTVSQRYVFFADHTFYLAAIPALVLIVVLFDRFTGTSPARPGLLVFATLALAALSLLRSYDYRTEERLFDQTIKQNPMAIRSRIDRAARALAGRDLAAAAENINPLLSNGVRDPDARLIVARAYELQGKIEDARRVYDDQLEAFPGDANVKHRAAQFNIRQADPIAFSDWPRASALYAQAADLLAAAIEKDPDNVTALIELGDLTVDGAMLKEEPDARIDAFVQAALLFEQAVELNPCRPDTRARFGKALIRMSNLRDAITQLLEADRLAPNDPTVAYGVAVSLTIAGEYGQADRVFQRAIALAPNNANIWIDFGVLKFRVGEFEDARKFFNKALELVPDHPIARQKLQELEIEEARPQPEPAEDNAPS